MFKITPVILVGGSGKRLWPLSRASYPKQFSKIFNGYSLFQRTVQRLTNTSNIFFESPIIITHSNFRFIVVEQLQSIGIDPGKIILEPTAKNTGPAILAATLFLTKNNPDSIILVLPSDHLLGDTKYFHKALLKALTSFNPQYIVTFGVKAKRPETGYGYLEISKSSESKIFDVINFVEKPNIADARIMVAKNTFLWNSGIYMFKGTELIHSFKQIVPHLIEPVENALDKGYTDLGFFG